MCNDIGSFKGDEWKCLVASIKVEMQLLDDAGE